MKNLYLLAFCCAFFANNAFSGTFTSKGDGITRPWTGGAVTWVIVGDADGIPDTDDDVTILATETITWNVDIYCRNLTVAGTLQHNATATKTCRVYGDYTLSGTELGNGAFSFNKLNGSISGAGSFNQNTKWSFGKNTTIQSDVTVVKSQITKFYNGADVTNLGNFTLTSTTVYDPGTVFTNGLNGILKIKAVNFLSGGTFDASSFLNTVKIAYTFLGAVPLAISNTYQNLTIEYAGTTQLQADIIILNDFTLSNNSTFVTNGFDMEIKGDFVKSTASVSFTHTAGDVITFNGTAVQDISSPNIAGVFTDFSNIVIDNPGNTVTFSQGSFNINQSISVLDGTCAVSGASTSVTLVSSAASTAIIGTSTNGAFSGNFNIQRYIDARSAGYSDVSSSIASGTFADWDDDNTMVYVYSPPADYPSAWGYDETTYDFVPITSSATAMTPGVGFEMYLDSDGTQTSWAAATVDIVGTPTIGDVDMSSYVTNSNDGWNLLGNPFHASLDWDDLYASSSGISTDIMFYDETIFDYVTVTTGSGALIAPEQGFWLQVTGAPSVVLGEGNKSNSNSSTYRKPAQELFGLRLKNENGILFTSGTHYRFDENPVTAVKGDLNFKKLPHPQAPALYSMNNKYGLKIKLLNASNQNIEIPLGIQINASGLYTISPEFLNEAYNQGFNCIQLIDHKTNTITNLSQETYQFYANEGKDESRFSLKLAKEQNCSANTNSLVDQISISRLGENAIVKFNFDHDTNVKLTITNAIGQELIPAQIIIVNNEQKSYTLPSDFEGIFMVNIWVDGKIISKKLFK